MKMLLILLTIFVLFSVFTKSSLAYDPFSVPNNVYGIHIMEPADLPSAANLVNSNGGAWGYVTFVITLNDRDKSKWQKTFDEARRLKLIPIVRVATSPDGDVWQKPDLSQIDSWVDFFKSLNWVIQNRYVIIGNEPNHSKEWGGEVNPEDYATYLLTFAQKLKAENPDYFVLPAGLDASAPTEFLNKKQKTYITLDEIEFLKRMIEKEPDVFELIDGWDSHSYANPGFMASANGIGRGSVRTFEWELNELKGLGINKLLPVFITETGWVQKLDGYSGGLSEEEIGKRLTYAYQNAWSDPRIVAVTPFILSYTEKPFGNFSWKAKDGNFYKFYSDVATLPKIPGSPIQVDSGHILGAFAFPLQLSGANFSGFLLASNKGQSIWERGNINLGLNALGAQVTNTSFTKLEPGHVGTIYFEGKTPEEKGTYTLPLTLSRNDLVFGNTYNVKIISESSFMLTLYPYFTKLFDFASTLKLPQLGQ